MNTKNFLLALLPLAAGLMTTSCSNEEDFDVPAAPQAWKTIPYELTVSKDADTRATLADGSETDLVFASGDRLFVTDADETGNIYCVLSLKAGQEGGSTATFVGELSYTGAAPTTSTKLKATLVSQQSTIASATDADQPAFYTLNSAGTMVTGRRYGQVFTGANALTQAVQKCSDLRNDSFNYADNATVTLTQQAAFLKVTAAIAEGTLTGTGAGTLDSIRFAIKDAGATFCGGSIAKEEVTTEGGHDLITFVVPVEPKSFGTDGAQLWINGYQPKSFGLDKAVVANKVYTVNREFEASEKVTGPVEGEDINWIDLGIVVNNQRILFADRNLGASSPTGYGLYYQWGCTTGIANTYEPNGHTATADEAAAALANGTYYHWYYANTDGTFTPCYPYAQGLTAEWYDSKDATTGEVSRLNRVKKYNLSKYCPTDRTAYWDASLGQPDGKTQLDAEDDAVIAAWGPGKWSMPTYDELNALYSTYNTIITNYTANGGVSHYLWTWCDGNTTKYGNSTVRGYKITYDNGTADNTEDDITLFLPAAGYRYGASFLNVGSGGYYWSSSVNGTDPYYARRLGFGSGYADVYNSNRFGGFPVRAVRRE
ncbi:MAG: hypothetical protein J6M19_00570 [Bacteroidaceae bacterium]|nr:hypothetical protein [Bacteroidaceae bacterium]